MFSRARDDRAREPQPRRGAGAQGARAHDDHRDPPDAHREAPHRQVAERQPALQAAQRADLRGARGGPGDHRSPASSGSQTYADTIAPEAACTSVQLHQQVDPEHVRRALERGPGDRRRAAGGRRQLAVLLRAGAVARDAHRALRAGHRHAPGRAQGPGRATARVVRRALDHVDLRPLRGERPLLPGAAAGDRGRGPGRRCSSAATRRSSHELRLHNGTIYRWNRPVYEVVRGRPHLRVENRVLPAGPTVVDIIANAAFYYGLVRVLVEDDRPVWSQMTLQRRRGELPSRRARRPRRGRSTGRAWARSPRPSSCCAGCCRWPTTAWSAGASTRRTATGCWASIERRCLNSQQRRVLAGGDVPPLLRGPQARPRRRAARDDRRLPRADARERAGPRLAPGLAVHALAVTGAPARVVRAEAIQGGRAPAAFRALIADRLDEPRRPQVA